MSYLNVDEIEAALVNLSIAYPTLAELIPAPHPTHENRQIKILRVGLLPAAVADGVLFVGGLHAREWVPPDALVYVAADLLEAYKSGTGLTYGSQSFTADEIRGLVEEMNLFFLPCANPDGRAHSQTVNGLWRKNRRPAPPGQSSPSCVGVDLNRNFDFLWDHTAKFATNAGVNTSADPCNALVYRGPAAASEPETKNVVWLLDNIPKIRWYLDVHSAIPAVLHSWGSDEDQTSDALQSFLNANLDSVRGRKGDGVGEFVTQSDLAMVTGLAQRMNAAIYAVRSVDYGVEPAFTLYPTSGASDDYAFSRHAADASKSKVFAFTLECGSSFQPAWSEAEQVIREVAAAVLGLATRACELRDRHASGAGGLAVSWGANRLDVFGVGTDNAMYHQWWDGNVWGPSINSWERHDGVLVSPPTVVSWGANRLDVFGVGTDNAMYHQWWDGNVWGPSINSWERHDGVLVSPPTVVSWGANRLDVFGVGTDNAMYHQWWDGNVWGPSINSWERHDGALVSPPTVVSWGANRLDVFGVGTDNAMYHQWWDGNVWGPSINSWERHDGVLVSPPTVVSWGVNRLDVFGVGTDNAMYHQWWDGNVWGPSINSWERHDGVLVSPPTVVSWGANRLDVFGVGTDNAMYHQWWDGNVWGPSINSWERHDGALVSPPTVVSWGANRLDVFGVGTDNAMYHQWWDGNVWGPSLNSWERHNGVLITR